MKLKDVKWFIHVNEPLLLNAYATPKGIDNHVRYVEVLRAIRQGLDEAGLSFIGNMGPDTCTLRYWPIPRMLRKNADPDPFIQAYCMHHYHSRFDWDKKSNTTVSDPMSITINKQVIPYCNYAHERNKPFLMTELGMFHYGWRWGDPAGVARHDNVLLETEFFVRAMNAKVDGILRWAWLNPGNLDGMWQLIETIDKSDKPVLNSYYGYATLMRYIDKNAKILLNRITYPKGELKTVHTVAVLNSDKSRSLLVVNNHYNKCVKILIKFPLGKAKKVTKIVNDPVRKHYNCGEIKTLSGELEYLDVLSPMSLTVYTTKEYKTPLIESIGV